MKKLIFTLMLSVGFLSVEANYMNSEFSIKLFDNSPFSVMFDNSWFGQPTTNFTISNVSGGAHQLKIVKMTYMPGCWIPMQQTVFSGCIQIPCKSKVFASINNCGKYVVNCVEPICVYENIGWGYGSGWGGNGSGWGNNGWNGNGNGYGNNYMPSMSAQQFDQLKYAIGSKSFDSSKLQVAKQAIGSNYLSAAQVKELMELMTFESTRLELAKYAYSHTVDKQNYYLVNNAFTFESSIWELNKYIYG